MLPAVSVTDLGKKYRIQHAMTGDQSGYRTLRDELVRLASAPLRRWRNRTRADRCEDFWALKNVSFEVQPGEAVAIIGRNGAGKSTLLKILARITKPTTGSADLRGRVGSLLEVGTGFHPELTGRDNIFLNGAILGMCRREILRKFDEIVTFAELEQFLDTPVKRYSSGMYVRLAFAVAAHLEPEIFFVDEVLAVGDASFQKRCLGKMGTVAKDGQTLLFVSHNMGAVTQLCPRALWVDQGQIKLAGPSADVVAAYLTAGSEPNLIWKNPSPCPPNAVAQVNSACVLSANDEPTTTVEFASPFKVKVFYEVLQPVRNLSVVIRLTDSHGNLLWTSFDTDTTDWNGQVRAIGRYFSVCTIPGNMVRPGRYFLSVGAVDKNVRLREHHENALAFDVSQVGYHIALGRKGILTPLLAWEIQALEREPLQISTPH